MNKTSANSVELSNARSLQSPTQYVQVGLLWRAVVFSVGSYFMVRKMDSVLRCENLRSASNKCSASG